MLKAIFQYFSFVIIIFLNCEDVQAQFHFEVEAGVNYSNVNRSTGNRKDLFPENYFDTNPGLGFFFGVIPYFQLRERISIYAPIQYSQEGHKEYQDAYKQYKAGYLRIMPQAEIRVYKGLHFSGGANIGLLVHEQILNAEKNWVEPNLPLANNSDVAIVVGLKYYIKSAFISLRYTESLFTTSNIRFASISGVELDISQLNNNFQFGVGYRFK